MTTSSEMTNAEKYHFTDFTYVHYRDLLKLARSKYQFSTYPEALKESNFILWRHDVDFSMHTAKTLATIEKEEGVASNYFIHLHSEFYNVFEKEISLLIEKILEMGHTLGLHFDTHYYGIIGEKELDDYIEFEKSILEKISGVKINTFSFHNTNPFILSCQKETYGGLINTYSTFFQKNVAYCSDSNGFWRHERLHDFLNNRHEKAQVLTHPEWWTENIMSPKERIWKCIDGRANNTKEFYVNSLINNGRLVIDWE